MSGGAGSWVPNSYKELWAETLLGRRETYAAFRIPIRSYEPQSIESSHSEACVPNSYKELWGRNNRFPKPDINCSEFL